MRRHSNGAGLLAESGLWSPQKLFCEDRIDVCCPALMCSVALTMIGAVASHCGGLGYAGMGRVVCRLGGGQYGFFAFCDGPCRLVQARYPLSDRLGGFGLVDTPDWISGLSVAGNQPDSSES